MLQYGVRREANVCPERVPKPSRRNLMVTPHPSTRLFFVTKRTCVHRTFHVHEVFLTDFPSLKHMGQSSAPFEAVADELFVAQVARRYLVCEAFCAVGVGFSALGAYGCAAVPAPFHAGVVQWVYVNGLALAVKRQLLCSGNAAVVEAGGVVGCHGRLVVGVEVIDKRHAFYWIAGAVERFEDVKEVAADVLVAD